MAGGLNKLNHGRRSGVVVCSNANDNTTVFSVNHYRVYYIGIIVTKRCKRRLMGLKTAIQRRCFLGSNLALFAPSLQYCTYNHVPKGSVWSRACLVPVRRFPSPSRSIHFGDVSEANGRETFSIGPRDPKRFGRAE